MVSGLISSFLEDLVKDAVEQLNKFLVDLLDIALNCQNYITNKHLIKGLDFNKINAVIVCNWITDFKIRIQRISDLHTTVGWRSRSRSSYNPDRIF